MRSWRSGSLLVAALVCGAAGAQAPQKSLVKTNVAHKAYELTLAGLRPGRDTLSRAKHLYKSSLDPLKDQGESNWEDACHATSLVVSYDQNRTIETIRVMRMQGSISTDCFDKVKPDPWRTGHGLAVDNTETKVVELYGEPDSRSPSTKDGQPLELLYYAFDWVGPDVPQVMEVLCTVEKDGKPGRVVEITLAAPSL